MLPLKLILISFELEILRLVFLLLQWQKEGTREKIFNFTYNIVDSCPLNICFQPVYYSLRPTITNVLGVGTATNEMNKDTTIPLVTTESKHLFGSCCRHPEWEKLWGPHTAFGLEHGRVTSNYLRRRERQYIWDKFQTL
jgi:hypothetical protein